MQKSWTLHGVDLPPPTLKLSEPPGPVLQLIVTMRTQSFLKFPMAFFATVLVLATSHSFATETAPAISARSPEVMGTYKESEKFVASLKNLSPRLQRVCKGLLDSQLKLQVDSDSWKMYSLYEMFEEQRLMTSKLQRVATVTELADAIPKYTAYRLSKDKFTKASALRDGVIMIADKGTQCGPDPLSVTKGAYFLKCGEYLIGSGLVLTKQLATENCLKIRVLEQKF